MAIGDRPWFSLFTRQFLWLWLLQPTWSPRFLLFSLVVSPVVSVVVSVVSSLSKIATLCNIYSTARRTDSKSTSSETPIKATSSSAVEYALIVIRLCSSLTMSINVSSAKPYSLTSRKSRISFNSVSVNELAANASKSSNRFSITL